MQVSTQVYVAAQGDLSPPSFLRAYIVYALVLAILSNHLR
jgi:hypothetical protein